jgi:CRP-like cAMP-binding protein
MPRSETRNLQAFLDRLTSRSVLTGEEQQAILDLPTHAEQVDANSDFVGLGEIVDHVSLIVSGLVGRFDQNSEGSRQITAIHVAGDMTNLHSVVQPQETSALQALSVATILSIPHSAIRAATARHPALAEALWRDCMVDAAILSQWVVNVGRCHARTRIAHLLCEMAIRLKAPVEREAFTFPFLVTQAQIADATGLTSVHVNRVLKVLRAEGLVDVKRREVVVQDWDGLMLAGDFDPNYLQMNIQPEERLRIVRPL